MFFFFGTGIPLPVSLALLIGPYLVPTLLGGGLSYEDVDYYGKIVTQKVRNTAYPGYPYPHFLIKVVVLRKCFSEKTSRLH